MAYKNKANTVYSLKSTPKAVIARSKNEACYFFGKDLKRVVNHNEVVRVGRATMFWQIDNLFANKNKVFHAELGVKK